MAKSTPCPNRGTAKYKKFLDRAGGNDALLHAAYIQRKGWSGIGEAIDRMREAQERTPEPTEAAPTAAAAETAANVIDPEVSETTTALSNVPPPVTLAANPTPLDEDQAGLAALRRRRARNGEAPSTPSMSAVSDQLAREYNLVRMEFQTYRNRFAEPGDDFDTALDKVEAGLRNVKLWEPGAVDRFLTKLEDSFLARTQRASDPTDVPTRVDDDRTNEALAEGGESNDQLESGTKEDMYNDARMIVAAERAEVNQAFARVMSARNLTDALTQVRRASLDFKRDNPDAPVGTMEHTLLRGDLRELPTPEAILTWARSLPADYRGEKLRMFRSFVASLVVQRKDKSLDADAAIAFFRSVGGYGSRGLVSTKDLKVEADGTVSGGLQVERHHFQASGIITTMPGSAATTLTTPDGRAKFDALFDKIYAKDATGKYMPMFREGPEMPARAKAYYTGPLSTEVKRYRTPYAPQNFSRESVKARSKYFATLADDHLADAKKANEAGDTVARDKHLASAEKFRYKSSPWGADRSKLGPIIEVLDTIFGNANLHEWLHSDRVSILKAEGDTYGLRAVYLMQELVGNSRGESQKNRIENSLMWRMREALANNATMAEIQSLVAEALTNRKITGGEGETAVASDRTALQNFLESGSGTGLALRHMGPTGKAERATAYASRLSDFLEDYFRNLKKRRDDGQMIPYFDQYDLERSLVEGMTPDGVPILSQPAGVLADRTEADTFAYAKSAKETPPQILDAVLEHVYKPENASKGVHKDYASFWIQTNAKTSMIVNLPRGVVAGLIANRERDMAEAAARGEAVPAAATTEYGKAWEAVKHKLAPVYDGLRPKDAPAVGHSGPTQTKVAGGVKDVKRLAVPVGISRVKGGAMEGLKAFMDGANVGSPEDQARTSRSYGRAVKGDKSHKLADRFFGKHYTSYFADGSAAPGSPMHEFLQSTLAATGADHIPGMGSVKTGISKAELKAVLGGDLAGLDQESYVKEFADVQVGDRFIRYAILEVPFVAKGAAELESDTSLHNRGLTSPVVKDIAMLRPATDGAVIAERDDLCRRAGLELETRARETFGTALSPSEESALIDDPVVQYHAQELAKRGVAPHACLYTLRAVVPKLISQIKKAAAVITPGAKMVLVDSGMYMEGNETRSVTGKLDPFVTGFDDYSRGALYRANLNDPKARIGAFVKEGKIEEFKKLVVEVVTLRRTLDEALKSGKTRSTQEMLSSEIDDKTAKLLAMMVYSHGKGGPVDIRTQLDDLVTADGKFDERAVRNSPEIAEIAEAAGAAGSPYIAGMETAFVSRVPGVVLSSQRVGTRLSEPVAWVERPVTYKKAVRQLDESGQTRRVLVDVTETMFAPALSNEMALHPEVMKAAGEDLDGDATYLATWAVDDNTGVRKSLPDSIRNGNVVDNLWKGIESHLKAVFGRNRERYGVDGKLSDAQREARRRQAQREIDDARSLLSNDLLDALVTAYNNELKVTPNLRENNRLAPQIDVETIRRLRDLPLKDSQRRVEFIQDEASRKHLTAQYEKFGLPIPDGLLDEKVTDGRVFTVPAEVMLDIDLGPLSKRGGYDGALRKEIVSKYAASVRGIFAATARTLSTGVTAGASFEIGRPVMKVSQKTGKRRLARERGVGGSNDARVPLQDGTLFDMNLNPVFGVYSHDGDYSNPSSLDSLRYAVQFLADNLNTIIDAEKQEHNEITGYRLIPELYQVELTMSLSAGLKSYDEARAFHVKFMEWSTTRFGEIVIEEALNKNLPVKSQPKFDAEVATPVKAEDPGAIARYRKELRQSFPRGSSLQVAKAQELEEQGEGAEVGVADRTRTGRKLFSLSDRIFERMFRAAVFAIPELKAQFDSKMSENDIVNRMKQLAVDSKAIDHLCRAHDIAERFRQATSVFSDFMSLDKISSLPREPPFSADAYASAVEKLDTKPSSVDFKNTALVRALRETAMRSMSMAADYHRMNPLLRESSEGAAASFGQSLKEAMAKAAAERAGAGLGGTAPVLEYRMEEYVSAYLSADSALAGLPKSILTVIQDSTPNRMMTLTHAALNAVWNSLTASGLTNQALSLFQIPGLVKNAPKRVSLNEGGDISLEQIQNIQQALSEFPTVTVGANDPHAPWLTAPVTLTANDITKLLAAYSSIVYGARLDSAGGGFLGLMPSELLAEMTERQHGFALDPSRSYEDAARTLAERFVGVVQEMEKGGSTVVYGSEPAALRSQFNHTVYNIPVTGMPSVRPATLSDMQMSAAKAENAQIPSAKAEAEVAETPAAIDTNRLMFDVSGNGIEIEASKETLDSVRELFSFVQTLPRSIFPAGVVTKAVETGVWKVVEHTLGEGDGGLATMAINQMQSAKASGIRYQEGKILTLDAALRKRLGDETMDRLLDQHPWFVPVVTSVAAFSSDRVERLVGTEIPKWEEWARANVKDNVLTRAEEATVEAAEAPAPAETKAPAAPAPVAAVAGVSPEEAARMYPKHPGRAQLVVAMSQDTRESGFQSGTGVPFTVAQWAQRLMGPEATRAWGDLSVRAAGQKANYFSVAPAMEAWGQLFAKSNYGTNPIPQADILAASPAPAPAPAPAPEAPAAPAAPVSTDVDRMPDDSLAILAQDGTVIVNEPAARADFDAGLPYLAGNSPLLGSKQKAVVFKDIDLAKFKAALGTADRYIEFIKQHEEGHKIQRAAGKKGFPKALWMTPGAIAREREANEYAFNKLNIPMDSITKSAAEARVISAAVIRDGLILEGQSHAEALLQAFPNMTTSEIDDIRFSDDAGFMVDTDAGVKFMNRAEAMEVARRNGQLKPAFRNETLLHSNMIFSRQLEEFGAEGRVSADGNEFISSLAAEKLGSGETWGDLVANVVDRMDEVSERDTGSGLNRATRQSYRASIQREVDQITGASSYAQVREIQAIRQDNGSAYTGTLAEFLTPLVKYRPLKKWMDAIQNAARENPTHPYIGWLSLQRRMRELGKDEAASGKLYSDIGGGHKLAGIVDGAYHELVLRDDTFRGSGAELGKLLARYETRATFSAVDTTQRSVEAAEGLTVDPSLMGSAGDDDAVVYNPVAPSTAVVQRPPQQLLNLVATDEKFRSQISPDDIRPALVEPVTRVLTPDVEERTRARVMAMEHTNLQPVGGKAPPVKFNPSVIPPDATRDGDVLCGWPDGKPPAWRVYTFANPEIWMRGEAEHFARLRGENARLATLQRYAEWAGQHKARADRLHQRISRLLGLDHQGLISKMYKTDVRQVKGVTTDARDSIFARLETERAIAEKIQGNDEYFLEPGGEGYGFTFQGLVKGVKDGRLTKIGTVAVMTEDEQRDAKTFLRAVHMLLADEAADITAIRGSEAHGIGSFQKAETSAKIRKLYPESLANSIIETLKTHDVNWLLDNGYLTYSPAMREYALSIPPRLIVEAFKSTSVYKKLTEEGGRPAEFLEADYLQNMVREFFNEEREQANRTMPWFMTTEGDPVRFRKNYIPMEFGTGWYAKSVDNLDIEVEQDIVAKLDEESEKKQAAYEGVLAHSVEFVDGKMTVKPIGAASDSMLKYLHRMLFLRHNVSSEFVSREVFLAGVRSGMYEAYGVPAGANYATVAQAIHDMTMQELFIRKMKEQELRQEVEGFDPVLMVRVLRNQLRGMPAEEPSYLKRRVFKSYADAWAHAGLLPSNTDLTDVIRRYGEKSMEHTARKLTLNSLLMSADIDGRPLVVALPNMDFGEQGVIEDATWETAARMWARYFETPYDETVSGKENAHRIATANVVGQSSTSAADVINRRHNYVAVTTDYASVSGWYGAMDRAGESNILDLTQGGESAAILKQLMDSTKYSNTYRALSVINDVNSWTKSIAMQFSLFHPGAIFEDVVAGTAGKALIPRAVLDRFKAGWAANRLTPMEIYKMMKTDSPYLAYLRSVMEATGITWCYGNANSQDIGFDKMQAQLGTVADKIQKTAGDTAAQNFREVIDTLTQEQSSFVFEYMNNIGKIAVAHGLLMEGRMRAIEAGKAFDPVASMRPMSQAINEAVGGLNFTQYSWYTPQVRQLGNLAFFSLQWTMGAWNAAGGSMLTGRMFDTHMTPEARAFIFKRRIPVMIGLVTLLQPAVWQAALYAMAKLAGGADDPDDTPWIWDNESGKQSFVDITPFAKKAWPWAYEGGTTGKRRVYARWGKQLHEIVGWFEDPVKTLLGKSSLPVQTAYSLMTGKEMGTGMNLGFYDTGLTGWASGKEGFSDSRTWYIAKRALPVVGTFSVGGWLRNPDAGPFPFFASVSRGASYRGSTDQAQEILRAWADTEDYLLLRKDQKKRADLQGLLAEVLDAAHRNGYPPDKILDASAAAVLKTSYERFYFALDKGDKAGVEEAAREILRLNGTVEGMRSSVRNRNNLYGKPRKLTDDQKKAIAMAFNVTEAQMVKEERKEERREKKHKPSLEEQVSALNEYTRSLSKEK